MRTPNDDRTGSAHRPDRTEATRTPATGRAPETSSPALPGRLGAAGNAAVVQLLRQAGHPWAQERHEHGAGCGHQQPPVQQPPVQRSAVHEVLRAPGRPLDEATRTDMEARLGADFSDVRLHTDSTARASAAEVGARAYTSGNHVVIGDGGADRHTLAHELTHVIQQRQGPVAGTDNGAGLKVSDPSDRFEREAEANARRALGGPAPATPAPIQRAIGLEIETDRPVSMADGGNVEARDAHGEPVSGPILVTHESGVKMVGDKRNAPDGTQYTNAEFVTPPMNVLPGETAHSDREATLTALRDMHSRLYGPGPGSTNEEKSLARLYPEATFTHDETSLVGTDLRVAPERPHTETRGLQGYGDGLFAHQTVGVPLHGMAGFFQHMLTESEPANTGGTKTRISSRSKAHIHLSQSLVFGRRVADLFLGGQMDVDGAASQTTTAEQLRGFAALFYNQLAALGDLAEQERNAERLTLGKNKTAVLSRVNLKTVGGFLPDPARAFLDANYDAVVGVFGEVYGLPLTDWGAGAVAEKARKYAHTSLRKRTAKAEQVHQTDAFGAMTVLSDARAKQEKVGDIPIVPLELRKFGRQKVTFDELGQDVELLTQWSREALAGAQQAAVNPTANLADISAPAPSAPSAPVRQSLAAGIAALCTNGSRTLQEMNSRTPYGAGGSAGKLPLVLNLVFKELATVAGGITPDHSQEVVLKLHEHAKALNKAAKDLSGGTKPSVGPLLDAVADAVARLGNEAVARKLRTFRGHL
ncbi:DUF4157 domain-containing protein [Streptomyces sp. SKN60]|uniref:eCIS core domain-containing protein n=1 Tax=Streptomyces sp. SKN60 TaxID=2855506 RepID=UPI0022459DBE|nr:DUF4157 domain-containing protein [Streptomyces sp. SKN60]